MRTIACTKGSGKAFVGQVMMCCSAITTSHLLQKCVIAVENTTTYAHPNTHTPIHTVTQCRIRPKIPQPMVRG